ncbi:hypothetical protein ACLX1H_007939 [Fusarium chlamydosporum]
MPVDPCDDANNKPASSPVAYVIAPQPFRPKDRHGFELAIICALPLEADAIEALFDRYWDDEGPPFDKEPGDPNAYSTGVIGRHNVVLSYMPGMGIANAATVASNCGKSFPGIKLALLVGVCGVIPFKPNKDEIVLGDVIISDGIIQYDFGRQLPDRFARKDMLLDSLGRPNQEIRGVLAKLKSLRHRRQLSAKIAEYLDVLRQEPELRAEYPGVIEDRLFEASYLHAKDQKSCEQLGCNGELVLRSRLKTASVRTMPAVHFGLMASGNSVMKSGKDRDRIAAQEGIIAYEMEGAGVWDSFPCIVVKGACDYADSHKSKTWQRYAAATAAACAKAFLSFWVPSLTQCSPYQSRTVCAINEHQIQPVFLVPFLQNTSFVGRDDILEKLQRLLFEEGSLKVALVGLGGIGKTQIALQLAYWMKEKKQDYSVFWVPALSRASFEQACIQIIEACGLPTADGDNAIESVRQYLSSRRAGKWLLVVDNADDAQTVMGSAGTEEGIYRLLPQNNEGRIVFTTRYQKLACSIAGRNIFPVPAMSRDEARSFLKDALIPEISLNDELATDRLLALLTYLPLANTQATAYMNENQLPLTEYLQLFENTDRDRIELLSAEFQDDTRYKQSQNPVATTWFISFNQIREADELASRILMFLAFIEPKAVPQSILPEGESRQQLIRAIGMLCGASHHKVMDYRERFLEETKRGNDIEGTTLAENHPSRLASQHALAIAYRANGQIAEAVELLKHVVAVRETTLAEDHPDRPASQHELAVAYRANRQIAEAVELLKHVVAVRETTLAEDHPSRLASQHELARAYQASGQIAEAAELLQYVVTVEGTTLAEDHPDRLASQHELTRAYQANGKIAEARRTIQIDWHHSTSLQEHIKPIGRSQKQ